MAKKKEKEEVMEISAYEAIQLQMARDQNKIDNEKRERDYVLESKVIDTQFKLLENDANRVASEKKSFIIDCVMKNGFHPEERVINLYYNIDENSFQMVSDALLILSSLSKEPIVIRISTGGGSTYEAAGICGLLRTSDCEIITEVYGYCMSAGVLILAAGDYRRVSRYSFLMDHSSSMDLPHAKIAELKHAVQTSQEELDTWNKWMDELTEKEPGTYAKNTSDKRFDVYFSPEQALAWGLCDEIF